MKIITRFPRAVREVEHCWIPLSDGTRLAARLWLPEDAESNPVPAILELIPYRKRDFYRPVDETIHPYFAGHGYACVRVDIRGSGESEGVLRDEYLKQEQDDALEILRWIAAQPWCTGSIGMMGISWGGFNSLQVAARRPPELKAIITVCSTDDRYADDVHYMGGCLLLDNLAWAAQMFVRNARPPDPDLVGERWRAMWLERLENTVPFIETWLRHQRRDDYWKHGSVCESYADITCAVYAIGGWADGYVNAVPRLLAGLTCPRKGLVGPWAHDYGHTGRPGPQIGFLQEALRWWDQWLKGRDTGIMDEPMYRVWMQESVPPRPYYAERPGRWVAEASWPSSNIVPRRFTLNPGRLDGEAAPEARLTLSSPQTTGRNYRRWCPYGVGPEMPGDQREDDGCSLVFDSAPLTERTEILGAPAVTLDLMADRPHAMIAVRLCDVAPDGASALVTYGLLNLTHRDSHEFPTPLVPGQRYRVRIPLGDIAHAFPAGHRLRIAVSTSYWPIAWPSPAPVRLTVFTGTSQLDLPIRPPRSEDAELPAFEPAEGPPPLKRSIRRPVDYARRIEQDVATGETVLTVTKDGGAWHITDLDLDCDAFAVERASIRPDDPLSARYEVTATHRLGRGHWRVRTQTRSMLTATADTFRVELDLDAYEGDTRVFCKSWALTIPRDNL